MPSITPPILQAKLHRPPVTRDLIARPLLFEQLNQGLERELTLVSSPAGFGKTTLVSSWVENLSSCSADPARALPVAWLTLDQTESDLVVFVRYVISAIRTIKKDACEGTFTLLHSSHTLLPEVLAASLSSEIEQFESSFILVLDDYHKLRGKIVSDFLTELLNYWPAPLHLVLISRTTPSLPLARLRANDRLIEIRSGDLRFSDAETVAFFERTFKTTLDQGTLVLLDEKIEGWVAGLRLAGLSMSRTGSGKAALANRLSTDANIADYLVEEVFSQQVPAIQTFLLKTSILDSFCAPLCGAVLGEVDPAWDLQSSIAWLERSALFITPLDDRGVWYRYHQVFRDVLQHRLLLLDGSSGVAELHRRAAAWFAGQGNLDEALLHSQEAGDLHLTARLMQQGLKDVLDNEERSTLERWLRMLPEESIQGEPWLLMLKMWVLAFSWQLSASRNVRSQLETLLDGGLAATLPAEEVQLLRAQLLCFRGQEEFHCNRPEDAIARFTESLTLLPHSWKYVRGVAAAYLGMSLQANGQGEAAVSQFWEEYAALSDKGDAYALRLLLGLCFNHLNAGNLDQLGQTARILLSQASIRKIPVMQNWARFMQGIVYFQRFELELAEELFSEIIRDRYMAQLASVREAATGLVLIYLIKDRLDQAEGLVELLSQLDLELLGYEEDRTASLKARLKLVQGDREGAFRWADAFTEPVLDRHLTWLEIPHLTRAYILLARNLPEDRLEAIRILEALFEIAERTYNTRYQTFILAQLALALEADGKPKEAQSALQHAVELSKPGDFIRVFVVQGKPMQVLLASLSSINHLSEPVHRILAAFPGEDPQTSSNADGASPGRASEVNPPGLVEPLTYREREILELMREPLSTKEIANRLSISPLTVKRHSINLYGKLGVNRRWDAVAKAITLGILPPR